MNSTFLFNILEYANGYKSKEKNTSIVYRKFM